jgi:hypothetical protein
MRWLSVRRSNAFRYSTLWEVLRLHAINGDAKDYETMLRLVRDRRYRP